MPRSPSSNKLRKALKNCSSSDVSIVFDFDCKQLEDFLFLTLATFCQDMAVIRSAREESIGLTERWSDYNQNNNNNSKCCRHDIENVLSILEAFMTHASPMLPTRVVYQVHTFRGLLLMKKSCTRSSFSSANDKNTCMEAAQAAFTKALWIAAAATNSSLENESSVPPEEVALTMHRLGRIHGAQGNYQEAINLLTKAGEKYQGLSKTAPSNQESPKQGVASNPGVSSVLLNAFKEDAKNASADLDVQRKAAVTMKLRQSSITTSPRSKYSPPMRHRKRLSFVQEHSSREFREHSSREFQVKH